MCVVVVVCMFFAFVVVVVLLLLDAVVVAEESCSFTATANTDRIDLQPAANVGFVATKSCNPMIQHTSRRSDGRQC